MTATAHHHHHHHDHGNGHDHEHGHDHDHLEGYHVHGGAPALDIGGDVGAMVVTLDRDWLGTELHLRSAADPDRDVHTGVWERRQGGTTSVAAVFAQLLEGVYEILDRDAAPVRSVRVHGGRVATEDLRST